MRNWSTKSGSLRLGTRHTGPRDSHLKADNEKTIVKNVKGCVISLKYLQIRNTIYLLEIYYINDNKFNV